MAVEECGISRPRYVQEFGIEGNVTSDVTINVDGERPRVGWFAAKAAMLRSCARVVESCGSWRRRILRLARGVEWVTDSGL